MAGGFSPFNNLRIIEEPTENTTSDQVLVRKTDGDPLTEVGRLEYVDKSKLSDDKIPLAGTEVGKPITGDLEILNGKKIYNVSGNISKQLLFGEDGSLEIAAFDSESLKTSRINLSPDEVQIYSSEGEESNNFIVNPSSSKTNKSINHISYDNITIASLSSEDESTGLIMAGNNENNNKAYLNSTGVQLNNDNGDYGQLKLDENRLSILGQKSGVSYGITLEPDNVVIKNPGVTSSGLVGEIVFPNDGSIPEQYVQNDALQAFGDSQTLQTAMTNGSSALVDTDIQIQKGSGHGHLFINVNGVDINGEGKDLSLKGINTILEGSGNVDINGGGAVRINTKNAVTSINGNEADSTGAVTITSGIGSGTVTSVTGVGGEITVATGTTTPVVGISTTYTTARDNYANSRVADNLTASTTVAPSKSAVNTALALKADDNAVVKIAGTQTVTGLKNFTGGFGAESIVSTNGSAVGTIYLGLSSASAYLRRNNADAISAWQTINMSSASTGNIHDFSSNVGGTTAVRASIPKNGIATSAEHLTRKDYVDGLTGWASYTDTAYTSGAPFTINSGVTSTLPNNAGTVINNQLPAGVTSFYNSGTGKFTPITDGDYYIVTIRFKAQTTAPTAGYLDFGIDIGGAFGVQFKETKIFAKGAGIEHNFSVTVPCYTGSTFVANGGLIKLTSGNGNMTVYDINFQFDRVHKSK